MAERYISLQDTIEEVSPSANNVLQSNRVELNDVNCTGWITFNGGGRLGNLLFLYSFLVYLNELYGKHVKIAIMKNMYFMLSDIYDLAYPRIDHIG